MQSLASFLIVILLQSLLFHVYALHETTSHDISKHSSPFPSDFLFGTASSAYQYEGAYLTDGKSLNNWDVFTHEHPENILDESNGDVAVDQYHRFMEDVDLMISLGVKSYRFSISWSRVLPRIKPFVTLNHMDYPQEFENRFQGWLSPEMQKEFVYLADLCFMHFGNRVKYWTTINEPNQLLILGYKKGIFPPARCSSPYGNCSQGNSETEPFIAAHNSILAHAKAVNIYKTKYQKEQNGSIGIVVQTSWFEPVSDSTVDKEAAERAQSFYSNWILDPVMYGTYPKEMVNILGPALPRFSINEVNNLQNSRVDFVGINHYTSYFIRDCLISACNTGSGAFKADGFALKLDRIGNVTIGELTDVKWQHIDPEGFRKMLDYLKNRYPDIPIFITENGFGDLQKPETTVKELLHDTKRIQYMSGYLEALQAAMRNGVNVKGYFAWSLLDNFEWVSGYKGIEPPQGQLTANLGALFAEHLATLKYKPFQGKKSKGKTETIGSLLTPLFRFLRISFTGAEVTTGYRFIDMRHLTSAQWIKDSEFWSFVDDGEPRLISLPRRTLTDFEDHLERLTFHPDPIILHNAPLRMRER